MSDPNRPKFLGGPPPPPYEPLDLAIVTQAVKRSERAARKWALISTAPYIPILAALLLLGVPGPVICATVFIYTPIAGWFVQRAIDREALRAKERP